VSHIPYYDIVTLNKPTPGSVPLSNYSDEELHTELYRRQVQRQIEGHERHLEAQTALSRTQQEKI
jgi:hypothetical protein